MLSVHEPCQDVHELELYAWRTGCRCALTPDCALPMFAMCEQVLPVPQDGAGTRFILAERSGVHLLEADLPPVSLLTLFSRARQKQQPSPEQLLQQPADSTSSLSWLPQVQEAAGSERLAAPVQLR